MKTIILFMAACAAVAVSPALADGNHAPVSQTKTLALGAQPQGVDLKTIAINPLKTGACSDADGDGLVLVGVSANAQVNPNHEAVVAYPDPGDAITLTFTVSDGNGGTATGTLILKE